MAAKKKKNEQGTSASFLKLSCTKCGADLTLDLDNIQAYCPYCGERILIDMPQLQKILSERERTKRFAIEKYYEDRNNKRKAENKDTQLAVIAGLGSLIALIIFAIIFH